MRQPSGICTSQPSSSSRITRGPTKRSIGIRSAEQPDERGFLEQHRSPVGARRSRIIRGPARRASPVRGLKNSPCSTPSTRSSALVRAPLRRRPPSRRRLAWPRDRRAPRRARVGAHRLRQDARRVPRRDRRAPRARRSTGALADATRVLYVSPLRALGNDVEKNLQAPLAETPRGGGRGGPSRRPELRVAVRTGDTPPSRRQALLPPPPARARHDARVALPAPHERARAGDCSRAVETVIVDEIHARRRATSAARTSRSRSSGSRRSRGGGRSASASPRPSNPSRRSARFLVGAERVDRAGRPRCAIVEVGRRRALDLAIEIPNDELSSVASNELWAETYDRIAAIVREHRSTLVFVNTRRLAERAAHALAERLGEGAVAAHHGSLSRARRLDAEERLKAGALRAVVATASLELGIDVGDGGPRRPARLARRDRGGPPAHRPRRRTSRGGIPKGRLFPVTPRRARRVRRVRARPSRRGAARGGRASAPRRSTCSRSSSSRRRRAAPIHEDRLFALVAARLAVPRPPARTDFDAVVRDALGGDRDDAGPDHARSSTATA